MGFVGVSPNREPLNWEPLIVWFLTFSYYKWLILDDLGGTIILRNHHMQ